jgi:DMSO/TMAO reductase YedYZ heme-binding membrane subunit
MTPLFRNIRFWILSAAVLITLSVTIHFGVFSDVPVYGKIVRTLAFWAAGSLYLTLLISPLIAIFPSIPWKPQLIKARRALGVSVVVFACTHAYFAFFRQLGGLPGLLYLDQHYLVAITVSAIANTIFVLMALTAFDAMVRKLGPLWKKLHRWVYVGALLVLFHALSIGSNFVDLRNSSARLMLLAVFFLLILEAIRFDRIHNPKGLRIGVFTIGVLTIASFTLATFAGTANPGSISIHSAHTGSLTTVTPTITSSDKRYTVSVSTNPVQPQPGDDVAMTITVFDASNGTQIKQFTQLYEQFLHIIIVDSSLQMFAHIHPRTTADGTFVAHFTFPNDGSYHVYFNFVPFQAPEQQVGVTVKVGTGVATPVAPELKADTVTIKQSGPYTLTMTGANSLQSQDLSAGKQPITFSIFKGSDPASLAPYVGAFGHLTLINTDTYEFVHAHPKDLTVPKPTDRSGPDVTFYPMQLAGIIKPGVYRAFVETAPDSTYTMVPFTLTVH